MRLPAGPGAQSLALPTNTNGSAFSFPLSCLPSAWATIQGADVSHPTARTAATHLFMVLTSLILVVLGVPPPAPARRASPRADRARAAAFLAHQGRGLLRVVRMLCV